MDTKKRYKSKYSNGLVDAPHYITELICEKIANQKQLRLTQSFWDFLEWKTIFGKQLLLAKALLKIYSANAIIAALKNPLSNYVYSLGLQSILDPIIQAEEAKIKETEKLAQSVKTVDEPQEFKHVKSFGKQSTINKLRGL